MISFPAPAFRPRCRSRANILVGGSGKVQPIGRPDYDEKPRKGWSKWMQEQPVSFLVLLPVPAPAWGRQKNSRGQRAQSTDLTLGDRQRDGSVCLVRTGAFFFPSSLYPCTPYIPLLFALFFFFGFPLLPRRRLRPLQTPSPSPIRAPPGRRAASESSTRTRTWSWTWTWTLRRQPQRQGKGQPHPRGPSNWGSRDGGTGQHSHASNAGLARSAAIATSHARVV